MPYSSRNIPVGVYLVKAAAEPASSVREDEEREQTINERPVNP